VPLAPLCKGPCQKGQLLVTTCRVTQRAPHSQDGCAPAPSACVLIRRTLWDSCALTPSACLFLTRHGESCAPGRSACLLVPWRCRGQLRIPTQHQPKCPQELRGSCACPPSTSLHVSRSWGAAAHAHPAPAYMSPGAEGQLRTHPQPLLIKSKFCGTAAAPTPSAWLKMSTVWRPWTHAQGLLICLQTPYETAAHPSPAPDCK